MARRFSEVARGTLGLCMALTPSRSRRAFLVFGALALHCRADPTQVREAILAGFAGSRILELHGARMNERHFTPGGTIVNQVKDLDAVLDVAAAQGLRMPLTARVRELFGNMLDHGQGDLDHSALILEIERQATSSR